MQPLCPMWHLNGPVLEAMLLTRNRVRCDLIALQQQQPLLCGRVKQAPQTTLQRTDLSTATMLLILQIWCRLMIYEVCLSSHALFSATRIVLVRDGVELFDFVFF